MFYSHRPFGSTSALPSVKTLASSRKGATMTSRMLVGCLTGATVAVVWASYAEAGPVTSPAARTTTSPGSPTVATRAPTATSAEKDLVRPRSTSVRPASARPTAAAPSPTTPKTPPATRPSGTRTRPPPRAKPKPVPRPAPPPTPTRRAKGPTGWPALDAAIARIPGYAPGGIRWSVTSRYGHWGATDLATSEIFISPAVNPDLLDSVVRHEYAHVVTVRVYGGDWRAAKSATNAAFGGSGRTGVERAADCMARAMGASWTQYTPCTRQDWRQLSHRLLSGRRL
jgi:hypothetical protein